MEQTMKQIVNRLKNAKRVAIFTHMRPDGDAIGSALALSRALDAVGVKNVACIESDLPSNLAFFDGAEKLQKSAEGEFDLFVSLDCADIQRLGVFCDLFLSAQRKGIDTINIDHHVSNTRFAKQNYVRLCAANCMNVATLISYLGASLDKKTAEYLLVGLLTDSGNFSHEDVDEEAFLLGAKLVKAGADLRYYQYNLFKRQSKARAGLYVATMQGIRYFHDDRFALIVITREAMQKYGADNGTTEGFVDFPLNIDGVEVAASVMEDKPKQYKISLRTKEYADANKIAGTFGGGGHVRAAGCMLFGELEEVIDRLSYVVSQYLE